MVLFHARWYISISYIWDLNPLRSRISWLDSPGDIDELIVVLEANEYFKTIQVFSKLLPSVVELGTTAFVKVFKFIRVVTKMQHDIRACSRIFRPLSIAGFTSTDQIGRKLALIN